MDKTVTVLSIGVEARHHRHVAALTALYGRVAERVDLLLVVAVDERARVGADEQDVEGLLRATGAVRTRCLAWIFLIWSKR